jgi:hypothetical protein
MYNGKLSMMGMFKDTDHEPGNFAKAGDDDQLTGKSAKKAEIIKAKELKNGLAMIDSRTVHTPLHTYGEVRLEVSASFDSDT